MNTSLVFIFLEVLAIATLKDNPINEQIRCKEMMVIGPNGEQLGVKSKQDALTLAGYDGFDLVYFRNRGDIHGFRVHPEISGAAGAQQRNESHPHVRL